MVKVSEFITDPKAMSEGMWVRIDPAKYGDLEILSCGFTDEMLDARSELEWSAADRLGVDRTRLPNAEQRHINAQLLERYLIRDVRNLEDDEGKTVTVEQFHRMMYQQGYEQLSSAAWQAARRISTTTAKQMESALGNSLKLSKSSFNGAPLENNSKA